jgi:glutamyl-tRNA reductase
MFRVGTGLDSLGDFEIISQIRTSFSQSNRWVLPVILWKD